MTDPRRDALDAAQEATNAGSLARPPRPVPTTERRARSTAASFGPVRVFGDYTLVKKLATGGMAEIWFARRRGAGTFNRFVVVKKILPHLAEQPTFVRMFEDEASTSSRLSHPNIVQIHDLAEAEGTYFIAMEYIEGENLSAIAWRGMKRGLPFPPSFAARVIADASKALHYAHTLTAEDGRPLEIVHRDVSPQNILVTYDGDVKVVDFGIAKAATKSEQTKTGMLKGKFSYMSPEQCLGAPVDGRSDIFALGILLYELCTGKRLYKHESELMILDMITKRPVAPPSRVNPDIPGPLEDIILRALAKDRSERFQSARDMQMALEAFLRGEPHPVSTNDVGAWMQRLFADKIEEKRRLRERASRDDLEQLFGVQEPTRGQVAARPASSMGVQVSGLQIPASPTGSSALPGAWTHPGTDLGWSRPLRFLGAALVIAAVIVATAVYFDLERRDVVTIRKEPQAPAVPAGPALTGNLTLESSPAGAEIHLDGLPMATADGSIAATPSDLEGLTYGQNYVLKLELDGYQPWVERIEMGTKVDGKTFHPTLQPFPGRLVAEVRGPSPSTVDIDIDGVPVGRGPRISHEIPGNTTVLVEARQPGRHCDVEPARVRVLPNQTARVAITCRVVRRSATASRPTGTPRRTASPAAPSKPSGCVTRPEDPPGYVTIATKPYSTIFMGGRKLGETPLSRQRLPSGCVEIEARTADGRTKTVKIEVKPNTNSIFRFDL